MTKSFAVTFLIFFLFVGLGYYSAQNIWEVEMEMYEDRMECVSICEDQGLEYVDYIANECLCRKHKFTLVNGEADKNA